MKQLIIRSTLFFFAAQISCRSQLDFVTVGHTIYKGSKYKLDIPSGYQFKGAEAGVEKEHIYVYPDSCFVYVTDFKSIPNADNIKVLGDSIFQFRFQNEDLIREANRAIGKEVVKVLPDTFVLSGIDKDGKYWKDIKIGKISVGYSNVSKGKLSTYERVLSSFRKN